MDIPLGVYAILWTQTMDALATMIVLPTMPFYAMTLGADAFAISMLGSAYNCAQMIFSPALGALSDRFGRKNVMLLGLTGQAIGNFLMSQTASLTGLVMVRIFAGVALSTGPVEMAYVMDGVNSESDLSHILALQRVMTSAGALLGPLVARAFDDYSFQALCRGLVCINMANLLVGMVLWKDLPRKDLEAAEGSPSGQSPQSKENALTNFVNTLRSMLTNQATAALLLVSWVYTLSFGISDGPEVMFFKEHFDFGKDQVCYFFVVTNLSSLVMSSFIPYLIECFGPKAVCKVGCLGAAVSLLLLIVCAGEPVVPYIYGALQVGLFGSMIGLSFMHLVRGSCPEALMGTMLGLQSSLNGFAGTVAPPAGGALYDWSCFLPYGIGALLAASAAGMYASFPAEDEVRPLRPLKPPTVWRRPKLRRVSTFGQPIYPDKSFTCQVNNHCLRLEMDLELFALYTVFRERLDKERGAEGLNGLHTVATVSGDMVVLQAEVAVDHSRSELGRSGTFGTFPIADV